MNRFERFMAEVKYMYAVMQIGVIYFFIKHVDYRRCDYKIYLEDYAKYCCMAFDYATILGKDVSNSKEYFTDIMMKYGRRVRK